MLAEAQAVGANVREGTADLGALRAEVESNLRKIEGPGQRHQPQMALCPRHGVETAMTTPPRRPPGWEPGLALALAACSSQPPRPIGR